MDKQQGQPQPREWLEAQHLPGDFKLPSAGHHCGDAPFNLQQDLAVVHNDLVSEPAVPGRGWPSN